MCSVESGYPPLKDLVQYKQHIFFRSMWQERSGCDDNTLSFVIIQLVKDIFFFIYLSHGQVYIESLNKKTKSSLKR